jgi:hypothetical protein
MKIKVITTFIINSSRKFYKSGDNVLSVYHLYLVYQLYQLYLLYQVYHLYLFLKMIQRLFYLTPRCAPKIIKLYSSKYAIPTLSLIIKKQEPAIKK